MHKTLKWETSGRRGVHVGPAHDMAGYNVYTTQLWDKPRKVKIYFLTNRSKAHTRVKYLQQTKMGIYFVISNFLAER